MIASTENKDFEISLLIQARADKNDIRTFYGDYDDLKDKGFAGYYLVLDRFVRFNTGPLAGRILKANTQADIDWIEIQMAAKEADRLNVEATCKK